MNGGRPAPFRTADVPLPDPYPHYRAYRERDPVHRGADDAWYLFRHADVAQVLGDRRYLRGGPPAQLPRTCPHLRNTVANWMVFMDPPRHTRVRALVAQSFTPGVVEALRPRIRRLAKSLVAELGEEAEADFVDRFAAPFPLLVISELLGVRAGDRDWFRSRAVDLQQATGSRVARRADAFAVADAAARELDTYFRSELARRRAGRERDGADLIAVLLRRAAGQGFGDEVLVGTCIHLLTAGHETTTNLLSKGLLALFAHPDQLALLSAGPELLPGAVEELIRYDPPVQMVTRQAQEDGEVGGRAIRRGSRLVLVLGSANRDPESFPDPDRLDLRRDTGRHSGFGMGTHYCVGASLARAEAELGLGALLRGLPGLAPADEPVRYSQDLVFHGPSRLLVRTGKQRPDGASAP
ncbi:cytochrome P450 [Streptomyces sp. NPDC057617]|uniref:cytochrome P450 n=1 Tax=Streptomyces sp. NPDC057617 TaxID=3346184 RepID=UPI0036A7DBD3